jgi:hypothetical protein
MTGTAAPHVGSVLGERYELVRHIGTDGLADVYEAEDQVLHRRVGVRLCRTDAPEDRARFETEARTLARVNEPGVARVYDAGLHGEDAFVVLQLVPTTAEEVTAPVAVVDPTGDVTGVIGGPDATTILPALPPLPVDLPPAARPRAVPVWGMVVGLAAVLVAILVFAGTRGPDAPSQAPSVVESTSTTAVGVHTTVRAVTPKPTASTAPTTTEAPTTTLDGSATTVPVTTAPVTTVPAPASPSFSPAVG